MNDFIMLLLKIFYGEYKKEWFDCPHRASYKTQYAEYVREYNQLTNEERGEYNDLEDYICGNNGFGGEMYSNFKEFLSEDLKALGEGWLRDKIGKWFNGNCEISQ